MPFIVIVFLVILVVLYYVWRQRTAEGGKMPNIDLPEAFDFQEDHNTATPVAARRVQMTAPPQQIRGKRSKIRVEARPLPSVGNLQPPPEKGIEKLIVLALNPAVHDESGELVNEFDPPLTLTLHFKPEDAAAAGHNADGTPRLSIITGYQSPDGWRFERLPTRVSTNKDGSGTLTAQVQTLNPKDPVWAGAP